MVPKIQNKFTWSQRSRTNLHGPKDVWIIEVRLYLLKQDIIATYKALFVCFFVFCCFCFFSTKTVLMQKTVNPQKLPFCRVIKISQNCHQILIFIKFSSMCKNCPREKVAHNRCHRPTDILTDNHYSRDKVFFGFVFFCFSFSFSAKMPERCFFLSQKVLIFFYFSIPQV